MRGAAAPSINRLTLIFEVPSRRSVKVYGTSCRRAPARQARYFISIRDAYPDVKRPFDTISVAIEARYRQNPLVRSLHGNEVTARA